MSTKETCFISASTVVLRASYSSGICAKSCVLIVLMDLYKAAAAKWSSLNCVVAVKQLSGTTYTQDIPTCDRYQHELHGNACIVCLHVRKFSCIEQF